TTGEWSDDLPTATNVGTYDVYYRVKGDDDHSDSKTETKIQVAISANDKTDLSTAISDAQTYLSTVKDTYGEAIVTDYQGAIDAAILVRDDNNKTVTEINDAIASLADAKSALDGELGEIDDVKATINALPAEVTLESESAINAAEAAYEALSSAQRKGISVEVLAKLADAVEALDEIKDAKANLSTAISDAQTYLATVEGTYGDAIADDYQGAIDAAILVRDDNSKTAAEINDAIASLASAKSALDGKLGEIDDVKTAINALPLPEAVTLESESAIVAARTAYGTLNDTQRAAIDSETYAKLTDAEKALAEIKDDKADLSTAISDAQTYLNTVKDTYGEGIVADYKNAIDAAILVRDDDSKTAAEINGAIASLTNAKNALDGDIEEVNDVKTAINALPLPEAVTLDSESAIVAAKTAYDGLTDKQQALIDEDTRKILTDAQKALADIKDCKANLSTAISDAQTYLSTVKDTYGKAIVTDYQGAIDAAILVRDDNSKTAAEINGAIASLTSAKSALDGKLGEIDDVKAAINALSAAVTLESESAIGAARTAYEALSPAQKEGVSAEILDKLVAAENALTQLKKDIADAERVISMINAIGEVTLGKEGTIISAREAYEALTEQGKSFIDMDTLKILAYAEAALAALKADKAMVDNAKALINSIGEVTLESEDKIAAARAAYDALTQNQKDRVGSHLAVILSNAENTLRTLKANKAAIDGYKNLVEQIGEVEDSEAFASRVAAAKAAYDALTDEQKQAVEAEYRVMTQKEQSYNKIVNDKKTMKTLTIAGIAVGGVVALLLLIYSFMFLFGRKFVVDPRKEKVIRVVPMKKKAGIATLLTMKLRTIHYSEADLYKRKKDAIAALEANKKQREEALNAIRAIGEVTLEKEQKIHAARAAFDALSDQQKAKIPTEDLNALEEAEETFAALDAEDAAREVEALISQIGKDPLEHEAAIIDARKAYDGLDENERSYFSAYSLNKLEKAEEALRIAKSKAEEKEGKEPEKQEPKNKAKKGNKDGEGAE
ncbi:MAG: hypothetical protein SPL80_08885, partial [Bacilli bacterium]|nr:hypothetical protein [Bacilli bacterium]